MCSHGKTIQRLRFFFDSSQRFSCKLLGMRSSSLLLVPIFTIATVSVAQAHITLRSPSPRTSSQKQGPCGSTGSTRGPAQTYKPGETITVEWDETVDHVGHYRIAFDMDGDDDFDLPNNPQDDFAVTLVDQITDRSGGGRYTQEITFPNVECDNCTLQLIQVMTVNVPYNSFYFQCADITLKEPDPNAPDAGPPDPDFNSDSDGCSTSGTGHAGWLGAALLALLGLARRRRVLE